VLIPRFVILGTLFGSEFVNEWPRRVPKISSMMASTLRLERGCWPFVAATALCLGALAWTYWTTLEDINQRWMYDPQYSHAYLVAAFSVGLLWHRRHQLNEHELRPSSWGLVILGGGLLLRLFGAYFHFVWLDQISLLPCLAGILLALGGAAGWRWGLSAVLFLVFMIPLPYRVDVALAGSLRRVAAATSTFILNAVGIHAALEGNIIAVGGVELEVNEACSGLRMLMTFLALTAAFALLLHRPVWQRIAVVVSAPPIAIAANTVRVTALGLAAAAGAVLDDGTLHDVIGWLMMPFALVILWLELLAFRRLFPNTERAGIGPTNGPPGRDPPPSSGARFEQTGDMRRRDSIGRIAYTAVAGSAIIACGLVHGGWTERWTPSPIVAEAASRLNHVSLSVGKWKGVREGIGDASRMGGIADYFFASYVNQQSGREVSVFLVAGRPGPVSIHTPDACYGAAGYSVSPPTRYSPEATGARPAPEFWTAEVSKNRLAERIRQTVFWSWHAGGNWVAPDNPRLLFAFKPFLYKLYLIFEASGQKELTSQEACGEFMRDFLPELDRALLPEGQWKGGPVKEARQAK
jgi:exosortase